MKLVYFNGRGLAETSRLLLAAAGAEYEDFRYPLEVIDWATHDFKKDAFDADKAAGKLTQSLDKLPYLEVDGHVIPQSKAIERFLAQKHNMYGCDVHESAQIDAICEFVRDFKQEYQKTRALQGAEREAGMSTWFSTTLPKRLAALDAIIAPDSDFAVGGQLSLADLTLFGFVTQFFDDAKASRQAAASSAPRIHRVVSAVDALPAVRAWIERRPDTPF